jgi:hypothetical protein
MTRRKTLEERWESKIGNCEVTPQTVWPIARDLLNRNDSRAPTAIHSSSGLKFLQTEKANAIVHCLENRFTYHDLFDEHVEANVQALLETEDSIPSEKIRPCDMKKLIKSLKKKGL